MSPRAAMLGRAQHLCLEPWAQGPWVPEVIPDQGGGPAPIPSSRCKQARVCTWPERTPLAKWCWCGANVQNNGQPLGKTALGGGVKDPLSLRLLELRRLPKAILTLCRVFDSRSKQERRTQSLRPSRISFAQTLSPPPWPSPPSGRATRLPAFQTAPSCALRSAPSHPHGRLSGLDSINSFKRTRRMCVNYTLISLNYTWSILHS